MTSRSIRALRKRPSRAALWLAMSTSAACFVAPYSAMALQNLIQIHSCADSGADTLRQALIDIADGGTIDATPLANLCSVITVENGELAFAGDNLTIIGPGADKLVITALAVTSNTFHHFESRIFSHSGRGTFALKNLSVAFGLVTTTTTSIIRGGCIESTNADATLSLNAVDVSDCQLKTAGQGSGGAISAAGNVYLLNSTVTNSQITGGIFTASGGAIAASQVKLRESTIAGNTAIGNTGMSSVVQGGGIFAAGLDIAGSTISGNTATGGKLTHYGDQSSSGGALFSSKNVSISDSTISGNSAGYGGGMSISGTNVTIANSTVAFNHSTSSFSSANNLSATAALTLDSSIFSNNSAATTANDISISGSVSAAGTHDLVFASGSPLPSGTIRNACALLAPLADNGGASQTHTLWSHSPAIGAGDNAQSLQFDQRGAGFPRTSGSGTDIGSYEVQVNDEVFGSGFDGC